MKEQAANCQHENVAAYLDGELCEAARSDFEEHLKSCGECAAELLSQRQLLCTLDVAFGDSRSFNLPTNFTRVVTTRAESDLRGVRGKGERRRALRVCVILFAVSFALLGAAARTIVIDPIKSFVKAGSSVLHLTGEAASEVSASASVVVRAVGHAFSFAQSGLGWSLVLIFLILVSLLLLLIARYHRAQIVE
jgi:anti-sigma factor RsiW